jgi:GABA(A) receptor-associated protein
MHYEKTFEERVLHSTQLMNKYPDRVPIIIKKRKDDKNLEELSKNKYLIPKNLDIKDIIFIIRKNLKIEPHHGIFVFVANVLVPMNTSMGAIYLQHKDPDGFLYITYSKEATFG